MQLEEGVIQGQAPYNQYPKGFLKEFTEPVTFKLVNMQPDPDVPGGWLMPRFQNIPATSMVMFKDSKGKSHQVRLALIRTIHASGEIEFEDRTLLLGQSTNGEIVLDPKNPKDVETFNYLNHCHWNKSSPYTYEGAEHIIYRWDPEVLAKEEMNERASSRKAIIAVSTLSDTQIATLYAQIGAKKPSMVSLSEQRNEMEIVAQDNPVRVLEALSKDNASIEALVNTLINVGAVRKLTPQLEFREEGTDNVVFRFQKLDAGLGSAEDQLKKALETDQALKIKIEHLIKKHTPVKD